MPVLLADHGLIEFFTFHNLRVQCNFDVYYYPFDEYVCVTKFNVLNYNKDQVRFNNTWIYMHRFTPHTEYEFTSIGQHATDEGDVSISNYHMLLTRRPSYVLVTTVIPIILMSTLTVAVFIIPNESGEKAMFAITTFLSFTILMTVILGSFPRNALTVSVFTRYLLIQVIQSAVITILALTSIRLESFDDTGTPVPPALIRCVQRIKTMQCKFKTIKCNKSAEVTVDEDSDYGSISEEDAECTKLDRKGNVDDQSRSGDKAIGQLGTTDDVVLQPDKEKNARKQIGTERSFLKKVDREQSVLENIDREKSLYEQLDREKSVLEKLDREKSIYEQLDREKSVYEQLDREKSVYEQLDRQKSVYEQLDREKSVYEQLDKQKSVYEQLDREKSVYEQLDREKSVYEQLDREKSVYEQLDRQKSVYEQMRSGDDAHDHMSLGDYNYTWKKVLNVFDILCFIFFSISLFVSTVSFFVVTVYKL